jgi:hypothetical protein
LLLLIFKAPAETMMRPAFRSDRSALAFSVLLALLLSLPVLLYWIGPPSREQAFGSMSSRAGPVGYQTATIYEDMRNADVVFVGSSMVRAGIVPGRIEKALSAHLGRPAHVAMLAMLWPGVDYQYFMLRDYLKLHRATMIVWNLPQVNGFNNEPHPQAYRWIRYGEYSDVLSGLPLVFRIYLYGEMVLGAPRELLSDLRPNLLSRDEKSEKLNRRFPPNESGRKVGFGGAAFVPDVLPNGSPADRYLMPVTSPTLQLTGPSPGRYQLYFLHKFVDLAHLHGCKVTFLHMPQAHEFGDKTIHALASWSKVFGPNYRLIGAPSAVLFGDINRSRFLHFYIDDNHLNENGQTWFTDEITSSVLEAYDESRK